MKRKGSREPGNSSVDAAMPSDERRRQSQTATQWIALPHGMRRRLAMRYSQDRLPMIPELSRLVNAELRAMLEASRQTELDLAFGFLRRLVFERCVVDGETLTLRVEVDAITATLVVGSVKGSEVARFGLEGDELTEAMALGRALAECARVSAADEAR